MSTPDSSGAPPRAAPLSTVAWLTIAVLVACGLLTGLLESMLVPLYSGSSTVPIAPVLAVLTNIGLPWLARRVADRLLPVALPFVGWLVTVLALGFVTRPEGDVILPGGSLQWVAFALIIGGTLAGTATVVLTVPPRTVPPRRLPPGSGSSRPGSAPPRGRLTR